MRTRETSRRGFVAVLALVLLGVTAGVVLSVARPGDEDAELSALAVDQVRARAAVEAGRALTVSALGGGVDPTTMSRDTAWGRIEISLESSAPPADEYRIDGAARWSARAEVVADDTGGS